MGKFSDLPSEIMLDIFNRLPAESVLDCRSVSNTWRNVLQDPSLSQTHSELLLSNPDSAADSGKFGFIFKMGDEEHSKRLYYLEYDDAVCSHTLRKLYLNPRFKLYSIVGSCNGLLCIKVLLPNHAFDDESSYVAYICNPITKECVTLPELGRKTYLDPVRHMSCGFGYVTCTKEYKVVRVYNFWKDHEFAQVEVYTLGSGKGWRNAGKIKIDSGYLGGEHAKFANGFLYWKIGLEKALAFDLADEVFVVNSKFHYGDPWIWVLGGYLSGTLYSKNGQSSDIWLLKKKKNESFRWSKGFSLINTERYSISLALTSSGAVLCCTDRKLHLYDLKSSSSKLLQDFGRTIYEVIPHMNTLVSLKAFGEENTKTLEARGTSKSIYPKRKNR